MYKYICINYYLLLRYNFIFNNKCKNIKKKIN